MCLKHLGVFELIRIEFSVTTFALKIFRCLRSVLAVRSNITRCYAFAFWVSRREKEAFISSGLVCYDHLVPSDHVLNYAFNPFTLHTFIFYFLSYLPDISLTRRSIDSILLRSCAGLNF